MDFRNKAYFAVRFGWRNGDDVYRINIFKSIPTVKITCNNKPHIAMFCGEIQYPYIISVNDEYCKQLQYELRKAMRNDDGFNYEALVE